MKTKMKSVLLTAIGFVFALCLAVVCGLGFKPAYTVSANTASTIKMEDGAQVRLVANDPGLRFTASISTEEYEAVKAQGATFGMFILPNVYNTANAISEDTAFGANAVYCWGEAVEGKTQIIHCSTDNLTQTSADGETVYFACALTNIKPTNYEIQFYATVYYEVNGVRTWAEANETNVRSVSYVAQKVLGYENAGTYAPTAAAKAVLVNYATQFVKVGESAGEVMLCVADVENFPTVYVDGEEVEQDLISETEVLLYDVVKGRHTATVEFEDGTTWDVPFVYADYVLRTEADINAWIEFLATQKNIATDNGKYVVVANDIVCSGVALTADTASGTVMGTTFDGYGHEISNFKLGKTYGFMGKTVASNCVVKDIAFDCLQHGGIAGFFGSTATGTFENVYIKSKGQYAGNSASGRSTLLSGNIKSATIKNCVIFDGTREHKKPATYDQYGMYAGALGYLDPTTEDQIKELSNVVVITTGIVISSNNKYASVDANDVAYGKDLYNSATGYEYATTVEDFSVVGTTDSTAQAAALKAFATNSESWTFDETTNTLYLLGNAVYTVA